MIRLWDRSIDGQWVRMVSVGRSTDGSVSYEPSQPSSMDRRTVHYRWSDGTYSTQALPTLSDGEGEARRFAKTVAPIGRGGSLTVIWLRRSCLSVGMRSVAMFGLLIIT